MTNDSLTTPDIPEIERLAHQAVQALPPVFRDRLGNVVFRVQNFADSEILGSVGLSNLWKLRGP